VREREREFIDNQQVTENSVSLSFSFSLSLYPEGVSAASL